jgi:hypothetical protein
MKNTDILDTPLIQEDTVENTVITNTPISNKRISKSKDPITIFVNKYYKLSLPKYKQKVEELYPENIEELLTKRTNKIKNQSLSSDLIQKEKKLLQSKMLQSILNKELFGLLNKFQNKQVIVVKSPLD